MRLLEKLSGFVASTGNSMSWKRRDKQRGRGGRQSIRRERREGNQGKRSGGSTSATLKGTDGKGRARNNRMNTRMRTEGMESGKVREGG